MNYDTCECGLSYVVGHEGNEAEHRRCHEEYELGPEIPEVRSLPTVASKVDLRISVVNDSVEESIRKAVAHVAMVAHRCMPEFKASYYGIDDPEESCLYTISKETRVIGMAVSSVDRNFWRLSWNRKSHYYLRDTAPISRVGPKLSRIWLAASRRRQGMAKWLVTEAAKDLNCDVPDLGWELPLTDAGRGLVKNLCADVFWGCGDLCYLMNP